MAMQKPDFPHLQRCVYAVVVFLALAPLPALAVDWIGADGDWEDGTQWSSGVAPGVADEVLIGGAAVVTSSGPANAAKSVLNAAKLSVTGGSLDIFSLLLNERDIVTAGGRLEANSLVNDDTGDVLISGITSELSVVLNFDNYGSVTVSQSAAATVGNLTNFSQLGLSTGAAVASETLATTVGAETHVDDAGTSVMILGDITNLGLLAVGGGASVMSESITNSDVFTVDGSLVEANSMINSTGGNVALSGAATDFRINGNVTNDGTFTLQANAVATVASIDNASVLDVFGGGVLTTESIDNTPTGAIDVFELGSRLVLTDNLDNDGSVRVTANATLEASSINTGGSLTASGGAMITTASITNRTPGNVTIEGPSTSVVLDNNFQNAGVVSITAQSTVTTGSVVNTGDIDVDGQSSVSTTTFMNEATGRTTVAGTNTSLEVIGVFENRGILHIDAGAGVTAGDYGQFSGTTSLDGGTLTGTIGGIDIVDGTLDGVGAFAGDLRVFTAAEVAPGTGVSPTTTWGIDGNVIFGGKLFIDIATSGFDTLAITGDAEIGGVIDVTLLDGYAPALGSTFDIILAASVIGGFSQEILPVFDGRTFDVIFGSDFVRLTVTAVPLPAALYLLIPPLALVCRRRRAAVRES